MEIKVNIPVWERWVRIIVGLFLLSLMFWGPRTWWGLIGLAPLLTAWVGFCPLYALLGIDRCGQAQGGGKPAPGGA